MESASLDCGTDLASSPGSLRSSSATVHVEQQAITKWETKKKEITTRQEGDEE